MLLRAENDWGIDLWILRSDEHAKDLGGNKYHKLVGYVEAARRESKKSLITMAGAHSNHLRAFAALTAREGLAATALIRGDELTDETRHSDEIKFALACGVHCVFVRRGTYRALRDTTSHILPSPGMALHAALREIHTDRDKGRFVPDVNFHEAVFVPEGGLGPEGVIGVERWAAEATGFDQVYIASATGTTCAGFLRATDVPTKIFAIGVLRNSAAIHAAIDWLAPEMLNRFALIDDYAQGKFGPYKVPQASEIQRFGRENVLTIDDVYGIRVISALRDRAAQGRLQGKVLWVYTYNE